MTIVISKPEDLWSEKTLKEIKKMIKLDITEIVAKGILAGIKNKEGDA